jgi:hypothetical protein
MIEFPNFTLPNNLSTLWNQVTTFKVVSLPYYPCAPSHCIIIDYYALLSLCIFFFWLGFELRGNKLMLSLPKKIKEMLNEEMKK